MASAEAQSFVPPKVEFIEDVATFMEGKVGDEVIKEMQANLQKLKFIEQKLMQKKASLLNKLPEITSALDVVKTLQAKRESGDKMSVDYPLYDAVYAKATLQDVDSVNLWLGANVMLEYSLEEAQELLETNKSNCKTNMETNRTDLEYIKDSITTLEVGIARIYNWDVERRREEAKSTKK